MPRHSAPLASKASMPGSGTALMDVMVKGVCELLAGIWVHVKRPHEEWAGMSTAVKPEAAVTAFQGPKREVNSSSVLLVTLRPPVP